MPMIPVFDQSSPRRLAAARLSSRPAALTFRDHRLQADKQFGDDRIKSSHSGTPFQFRNRNTEGLPRCWTGSPNPRLAS